MASIRKKDNGSYQIIVSQGYDLQGKKIQKTSTYRPKATTPKAMEREVRSYAQKFEEQVRSGNDFEGEKITLNEFVAVWFNDWAKQHLTKSVQEQYMYQLEKKVLPKIGHMRLSRIKPLHIQNIVTEMSGEGYAPKSVKYMFTSVNSVLKYAYNMEVIDRNPCDRCELPKLKQAEGQSFTRDQAARFLQFLDGEVDRETAKRETEEQERQDPGVTLSNNTKVIEIQKRTLTSTEVAALQYRCYFNLAIYGGLRRGEMIALTWKDIDFDARRITIDKAVARTNDGQVVKDPKTKRGTRSFLLNSKCLSILKQWKDDARAWMNVLGSKWEGCRGADFNQNTVFFNVDNGRQMNLDGPYHKLKDVIDAYNETVEDPGDRLPSIRLHDLRHTCATIMQGDGVDVVTIANRLGHDPSVTLGIYAHALTEMDEKAADILERAFAISG